MGLDCSHDAFSGAYSAFNRFRQIVAKAMGGSFPPHFLYDFEGKIALDAEGYEIFDKSKEENVWYWGDGYAKDTHPGLYEFFTHSDCEGEILPETCQMIANEMELLIPEIERLETKGGWNSAGHIARDGGYVAVAKRFITGCRLAYELNKSITFR